MKWKLKTGKAGFGTATVSISANNLSNCDSKYGYVKRWLSKWVPGTTREVTDALTVNASGSGSAILLVQKNLPLKVKDDIIRIIQIRCNYRSNYVPTKKKFENQQFKNL